MDEREVHQYLGGASLGGINNPSGGGGDGGNTGGDGGDTGGDGGDTEPDDEPTPRSLNAMTVAEIKALAEDKGYKITATKKSDIIDEFLAQEG